MSTSQTTQNPMALDLSSSFVTGLFGLYLWEILLTSWYCEISILRGRRPWRWTTAIYVVSRLSLFVVLFLSVTGPAVLGVNSTPRCQAFMSLWQVAEALAIALATLMLMLRVFAVYYMSWKIVIPFGVLNLGQLAVCMLTVLTMEWQDQHCRTVHIAKRTPGFIAAKYLYSLALDSVVLIVALLRLWPMRRTASPTHPLTKLLLRDGVLFYFIAVVANAIQISMIYTMLQHPGPTTRITTQNFSTVVSAVRVIAACRLYMSLSDFLSPRLASPSIECDCTRGFASRGPPVSSEFYAPQRSAQFTDPISIAVDVVVDRENDKTTDVTDHAMEMKILHSQREAETYCLQFRHAENERSYV